ncbi:MAG: protease modulator HflC, partial [Clostridia bacterium]|nr:protease modulator HflC [Clostridia bacterium]
MKKFSLKTLLVLVAIIAVIGLFGSMYSVAENEFACVVRFSKIVDTTDQAGLHFKIPFIDNIRFFPRDVQLYDINPSEVLTSDKKNMTVDSYVIWRISDPLTFFKTVGTIGEAERRLDAATYNTLKNVMSTLPQATIINQEDG